jgi:hypothetical protein
MINAVAAGSRPPFWKPQTYRMAPDVPFRFAAFLETSDKGPTLGSAPTAKPEAGQAQAQRQGRRWLRGYRWGSVMAAMV